MEFELRGEPSHSGVYRFISPFNNYFLIFNICSESNYSGGGPRCHCNDCVTAAVYVDNKAAMARCENISVLEKGNPQAAHYVFFRIPDVKLVKGGDKIMKYRLRPPSVSVRTYTSCCYTTLVCVLGPKSLAINNEKNVLINFNAVTPPIVCPTSKCSRISCKEALRPAELPNDGIKNHRSIPIWFLMEAVGELVFGSKRNDDPATRKLIFTDPRTVSEVAGGAACKLNLNLY